jgi:hypothetical protein
VLKTVLVIQLSAHVSQCAALSHLYYNILDTGHFALEEDGTFIAKKIQDLMQQKVSNAPSID